MTLFYTCTYVPYRTAVVGRKSFSAHLRLWFWPCTYEVLRAAHTTREQECSTVRTTQHERQCHFLLNGSRRLAKTQHSTRSFLSFGKSFASHWALQSMTSATLSNTYASRYVRVGNKFNKQQLYYSTYMAMLSRPQPWIHYQWIWNALRCSRVSNLATICHGISQCTESKALIMPTKKTCEYQRGFGGRHWRVQPHSGFRQATLKSLMMQGVCWKSQSSE